MKQYWAFLTHENEETYNNPSAYTLRVSTSKFENPKEACKSQFGCVMTTLLAKPLGTKIEVMRVQKRRMIALATPTKENPNSWRLFPWSEKEEIKSGTPIVRPYHS